MLFATRTHIYYRRFKRSVPISNREVVTCKNRIIITRLHCIVALEYFCKRPTQFLKPDWRVLALNTYKQCSHSYKENMTQYAKKHQHIGTPCFHSIQIIITSKTTVDLRDSSN